MQYSKYATVADATRIEYIGCKRAAHLKVNSAVYQYLAVCFDKVNNLHDRLDLGDTMWTLIGCASSRIRSECSIQTRPRFLCRSRFLRAYGTASNLIPTYSSSRWTCNNHRRLSHSITLVRVLFTGTSPSLLSWMFAHAVLVESASLTCQQHGSGRPFTPCNGTGSSPPRAV